MDGLICLANKNKKGGKSKPQKQNRQKTGGGKKGKARRTMGRVVRSVGNIVGDALMMTPCAAKYALAIANPWHPSAAGACVPSKPARPSQKVTAFARFDVTAPPGQPGYAVFAPCLASNSTFCRYTNGDVRVAPSQLIVDNATVGVSSVAMTNLPYTLAQLNDNGNAGAVPDVSGRMISFGVTAQYIGTELNRGGLTYCFTDPAHENLAGQLISDILARAETEISTPMSNRDKCSMQISAISAAELEYPDLPEANNNITANILAAYPFSGGNEISSTTVNLGAAPLVFIFTNPSTTGTQTFHIEVCVHAEYVGRLCEGKTTPNSIDEAGLARVMSASDRAQGKKNSRPHVPFTRLFKESLAEVAREAGTAALMTGKAMLMAALV